MYDFLTKLKLPIIFRIIIMMLASPFCARTGFTVLFYTVYRMCIMNSLEVYSPWVLNYPQSPVWALKLV